MPEWISKATCLRCKKKGYLAFNCPPKYSCKVIKTNTGKNNMGFKLSANNVKDCTDDTRRVTEFAGMVYTSKPHINKPSCSNKHQKGYYHHGKKIINICYTSTNHKREVKFNLLLYNKSRYNGLENTIIDEVKKKV